MPRSVSRPFAYPRSFRRLCALGVLLAALSGAAAQPVRARCCVWKVTDPGGHTLYLAGSVHALRGSDYPLPAPYDQAFAASAAVAFETDLSVDRERWGKALENAATLPRGVLLKDRVDPRTYAYILRVLANVHGSTAPEKKIEHLKPWAISWMLESPGGLKGVSTGNGVEPYFMAKARSEHKPMAGLVPFDQHIAVFGKMNDADSEAKLLLDFIHLNTMGKEFERTVASWKRGDIADIERVQQEDYRDVPSLRQRMLTDRNLTWMPKLEGYLRSGRTWMVIAGTGHMAGSQGLPALLTARGYKVEQL